jgi:hypothetical protein
MGSDETPPVAICSATRFHEAGHAVAAVKLNIGLQPRGIEIESDSDATTWVQELPRERWTKDWCERRAAVKVSGPAAEIRERGQDFLPDTLEADSHYATDYHEAQRVLRQFQLDQGLCNPGLVDQQVVEALYAAHNVIAANSRNVEEVAKALVSKPHLTSSEIVDIIERVDAGRETPQNTRSTPSPSSVPE